MIRFWILGILGAMALCIAMPAGRDPSAAYADADLFREGEVFPEYYPGRFTGMGRIDRIGKDEIVIDDTLHGLSQDVTYATRTSRHASWREFRPGRYVGYVEGSDRRITALYLIR